MFKRLILSAGLLTASTAVLAQQQAQQFLPPPPPPAPAQGPDRTSLTPQQQEAMQKEDASMAQIALQVAQRVDQGKAGEVWDSASTVAKQVVNKADFVKQVDADRAKAGKLVSRKLVTVTRSASPGGKTPAGNYININFVSQFANEKKPTRELISFHLDSDKTWRVSGYTLR